ncbi:amidohydrolase family protein [Salisaeta longa]|uniref:amidohydrolase family protein n=1 Tax=Salisaeta longa TaxID=503170 RepID=UPI000404DCA2|nr:amidohydrolase family protein [Salisaeta longa]
MRRLLSFVALLLGLGVCLPAATHAQLAIRADTLYTMTGPPIVNGVVVVDGTTIAAVGPAGEVSIPAGARVLETSVLTPGFVDAHATVGLSGLYNVPADQDQLDTSAPIQPHLRAFDAYNPREQLVHFVRNLGVTTVNSGHAPGALISGQTATFKTHGETIGDVLVDSMTTVAMTLGPAVSEHFKSPGTRAKGMAMLRAKFLEAQQYMANDDATPTLEMEALAKVLRGEVPALITAHRAHDIQAALRLAEAFDFNLILDGAAEAYLLTDEIKAAGAPVILHPTMIRPFGSAKNAAVTTAATLYEAGIPFAIQSGYEAYVPKTRVVLYEAAMAAAYGLPRQAALASITRSAANIIGMGDRVGRIAPGLDADLVLFDGDPLSYTSHACTVIVNGAIANETCD